MTRIYNIVTGAAAEREIAAAPLLIRAFIMKYRSRYSKAMHKSYFT